MTDYSVRRALKLLSRVIPIATLAIAAHAAPVAAQERLCDDSFEDCRTPIIQMIRAETVGIDVSYWFMDDTRYSTEIIKRWQAGVPVRIILDTRSDANYPASANVRQAFINAGIPIRYKTTNGINHWKMILYAGQNKMHFSAANFSNGSYSPVVPYTNYVDEAIYFTDDPALIHTFMTKYDSIWTDTTNYANLANVNGPLVRNYPTYPLSSDMNFPPDQDYQDRLITQLKLETQQIDVVMFRITSSKVPDQLIARKAAGVPIRLITDQNQYRNPTYLWHSYNIDRMFMAGIPIKWKVNDSGQDVHQKSVVLYGRAMTVFGSSNWTASSSDIQREHNYFTTKGWFLDWFKEQFERKWNNMKAAVDGGGPISPPMYIDFEPEYPEPPVNSAPANQALGQATSVTLKWEGGYWAHKYDIYFGTSPTPPLIATDFMPGSATAGVVSTKESFVVSGLTAGTTYYWKIVGKTMANLGRSGPTWSFTTSGGVPPPPAPTNLQGSAVSSTQVNLTWTDVAGEEGYKVERKATTTTTWTQIAQLGADVASYTDANSGLNGGSSYNYRVRAFTSGGNSGYSNTLTLTMPAPTLSAGDVSLHAAEATIRVGSWSPVADSTAAGGSRLNNPNNGAATITTPQASPANYFEMSFIAQANTAYRLWMRGKGYNNSGYSDSVYAQFSNSVNSGGTPIYRIGTTSGAMVNLEDCRGCGINGWGWQDDGFGAGVLGPLVYFAASGVQTIRVQVREDGFSIDQIVLSPDTYLNSSPGALKLDTTILPEQNGAGGAPVNQDAARVLADAYVRGGTSAATKFGTVSELITKFSADANYLREAYIKLDISDVTAGKTVKLRLFGKLSDTRAASVTTQVYSVADTTWTEAALTWNSKPAAGTTSLGSATVSGTTGQWYEVDLTSYAQAQRSAGKASISIALKCTVDTLPYITFGSRESGNKPELTVQ